MEDKERANMVLKRIGEMPYFDPEAIINVLVNEFALIRKETAQQGRRSEVCICERFEPCNEVSKLCRHCGKPERR